jgi:phytoene dehydrogenase-like protein
VESLDQLPATRAVLCDLTPRQLLKIAGANLPEYFRGRLERYRYGMGAFKVDWALDAPIPWKSDACRRAGTVHLGGTLEEIAASERAAWEGKSRDRPFVLLAQPSLFDPTRAPAGKHTVWTYCHVPHGGTEDMTEKIAAQIERFAPGFKSRVLAHASRSPADLERHNANLVGGDINGGTATLRQFFVRPTVWLYGTPVKGLYLCSASTPPGGGVHGMCGYFAAKKALKERF